MKFLRLAFIALFAFSFFSVAAQNAAQTVTVNMHPVPVQGFNYTRTPPEAPHILIQPVEGDPYSFKVWVSDAKDKHGQQLQLQLQVWNAETYGVPVWGVIVLEDAGQAATLTFPPHILPKGQRCLVKIFAEGYYGFQKEATF